MKGLRPKNLKGFAFGSYGWSGEAADHVHSMMEDMGIEMTSEALKVKNAPTDDVLKTCYEKGQALGRDILAMLG
jgi:flavorubredoxin